MNDWIEETRRNARVSTDEDPGPHLQAISDWKTEAEDVADVEGVEYALETCPPSDKVASSIHCLYAICAETIFHVCFEELNKASQTAAISLEDVLIEAYPLFQRVLIRYDSDRGELRNYLDYALRAYVKRYIESASHETTDEETVVEDESTIAPHFDIPKLYSELREEDRLPRRAERLWDRVRA